jgi:hypothetical protein
MLIEIQNQVPNERTAGNGATPRLFHLDTPDAPCLSASVGTRKDTRNDHEIGKLQEPVV